MPPTEFLPRAREELRRVLEDLGREAPSAAERLLDRLEDVLLLLDEHARARPLVYQAADREYRYVRAESYLLWYCLDASQTPTVVMMRHVAQRPPTVGDLEERAAEEP